MRGTGQGDFSRRLFDRRKHYSAVHLQQGRVQLDSDWNAQVSLARYRQETETVDVLGASGAPADAAGFGVEIESCLELRPGGHFVAIGGSEGCEWTVDPQPEAGFTLELRVLPRGDGVLVSRWVRHETGFRQADLLSLEKGRLRFARLGQPDPGHGVWIEKKPGQPQGQRPQRRNQQADPGEDHQLAITLLLGLQQKGFGISFTI